MVIGCLFVQFPSAFFTCLLPTAAPANKAQQKRSIPTFPQSLAAGMSLHAVSLARCPKQATKLALPASHGPSSTCCR